MQLFSHDHFGNLILAKNALKQMDYKCLECSAPLRVRMGHIRHPHFYHYRKRSVCRQAGKSLTHLQVQHFIQLKIGAHEAELEKHFESIKRIADVVWEKEKLIFEIQISPMSIQECKERTIDYNSLGYQVIWILHEKTYNQLRISPLEFSLFKKNLYFTNINDCGIGMIYDQWSFNKKGLRIKTLSPLPIEINAPYRNESRVGLQGDIASLCQSDPYKVQISQIEKEAIKTEKSLWEKWKDLVERFFRFYLSRVSG